jgi:SsrA-binding protein
MISGFQACIIRRKMKKTQKTNATIANNRKAYHDFFIEEHYEAGVVLQGWEVKSLRDGRVQLDQGYVLLKNGEAWLFGALITPLQTASTHINPDPQRTRKLLLHQRELSKLIGSVERKGYTLVPLQLYWKENRVKLEVGLAKGKKLHDKREAEKDRDWKREKERLMKKR